MSAFHIDKNIARAKTISSGFYTQPSCYEEAKEKIFVPSWQFICETDRVKNPQDSFPFVLLDNYLQEPLLLTRDLDYQLHCLSNVCTHRGNLLVSKSCSLSQLRCKYHGRVFSLDGRLLSMPEFSEVENFPAASDNLKELELFQWGKLLFTSLQPGLPAAVFFKEMQERMHWFPMENLQLREDLSKDYTVKANWALYCENYLEGFHIPFVHAGLNTVLDFVEYSTEIFPYASLQTGYGKKGTDCFELPADSADYGKKIAAYYFWIFPNCMFNFYPWGLSLNIVQPVGISETKISFRTYVLDSSKLDTGAGSGLDTVEKEDEAIVESVQAGIRSRFYSQGRYSVTREQGTHHFHSLLAAFMNQPATRLL